MMVVAPSASRSLARPIPVILPFSAIIVSASRIGLSMAPESTSPILRITSFVGPAAWGSSWAMVFLLVQCLRGAGRASCARLDGGIKLDYSFVYKQMCTNEFGGTIGLPMAEPAGDRES